MQPIYLECLCLSFVLVSGLTIAQREPLEIYPKKAAKQPNGGVSVTCVAISQLAECQFRVRYHYADEAKAEDGPVFNVTLGDFAKTQVNESVTGHKLYDIEYQGTGLAERKCGIHLTGLHEGRYLVGCRARTESGGWSERYMAVYVDRNISIFQSDNKDKDMIQVVVFGNNGTGIDLELLYNNLFTGQCALEGAQSVILWGPPSLYAGNTKCRLPIVADDSARGLLWAAAPYQDPAKNHNTWHFIKIILLKKPNSIFLRLNLPPAPHSSDNGTHSYINGDTMSAVCSVHESRYGADISWKFGNQTQHHTPDGWTVSTKNNTGAWTWPWETKTIEQTIYKTLSSSDDGKTLQCSARYYDSKGNVEEGAEIASKTLVMRESWPDSNAGNHFLLLLSVTLCFFLGLIIAASIICARRSIFKCCNMATEVSGIGMQADPEYIEVHSEFNYSRSTHSKIKTTVNERPNQLAMKCRYEPQGTLEATAYDNVTCNGTESIPEYLEVLPASDAKEANVHSNQLIINHRNDSLGTLEAVYDDVNGIDHDSEPEYLEPKKLWVQGI